MTITAVAVGTRGEVNPLVDLGRKMIKRGHEFWIPGRSGWKTE